MVPCSMPVSNVRGNNFLVSSGMADVVMSQSSGTLPRIESLTQPPTAYASNPCSCSVVIISSTLEGSSIFKSANTITSPIINIIISYSFCITFCNTNLSVSNQKTPVGDGGFLDFLRPQFVLPCPKFE